jgi:DNA polymerase elongation subunit (family B)
MSIFKNVFYDSWKNKIHLCEIDDNGETVYKELDHEVEYYIPDKTGQSKITDIDGNPVVKRTTQNKSSLKDLKDSGEKLCESDLDECVKFLHKRYGDTEQVVDIKKFNIFNIDIETEYPDSETINLIGIEDFNTGEIFQLGLFPYSGDNKETKYVHCKTEANLLETFCRFLKLKQANILVGWNNVLFDMPKIQDRIDALQLTCKMSPLNRKTIRNYDGSVTIPGIDIIDMMELYKKFTMKSEPSFSLNYIANLQIQEGKLEYEGTINDFWKTDPNRFVDYNFQDLRLVSKIDAKMGFLPLAINLCVYTRTPYAKVTSTVAVIEGYILRHLHKNNQVMPDIYHDIAYEKSRSIKGGHVETEPGFYINSMSIDATALYPHNMMMFNVSKETKVVNPSEDEIPNLIKTPVKGIYYRKDKPGVIPIVVKKLFDDRKILKAKMKECKKNKDYAGAEFWNTQQLIVKVLANGAYGCLLEVHFHLYDYDNGSVITAAGREAIIHVKKEFDNYMKNDFYKIAKDLYPNSTFTKETITTKSLSILCDTDSRFFNLNEVYKALAPEKTFLEFALDFQQRVLEPFLDKIMNEFAEPFNTENKIHFKREKIIAKIYVQKKKKYATLNLANEEEIYDTPNFAVTGLEIKKSDLCKFSRESLGKLLHIMFEGGLEDLPNKQNMLDYIREQKLEFVKQGVNEIGCAKGLKDFENWDVKNFKDFKPKTPIYYRAGVLYNYIVDELNLPYQKCQNGTKINYVYVNTKNKYKTDVIGYIGNWPKEFDSMFQIDYELQFEKQYLDLSQRIFDTLGFGEIIIKKSKLMSLIEDD